MTDENEDDEDEFEPLEVFPDPVHIKGHDPDAGGPSVVRLFLRAGAHSGWPGGRISGVFVIEDGERVSIGLVQRELDGQGPDGMMHGPSLQMGGWASLDVVLSCPLGTRSLLDASTGELVPPVERELGRPAIVGCGEGALQPLLGQVITLDGASGDIYAGELATRSPEAHEHPALVRLAGWAADCREALEPDHPLLAIPERIS